MLDKNLWGETNKMSSQKELSQMPPALKEKWSPVQAAEHKI